ncbi:MAG TPA: hypothetical protein VHY37_12125 [Tepidisphaeraceae bacterium]|nr:hypothetical protein [Tepidisphaeraceae bacterium]
MTTNRSTVSIVPSSNPTPIVRPGGVTAGNSGLTTGSKCLGVY